MTSTDAKDFTPDWNMWCPEWLTAKLALDDWRGRIERVAAQEVEHFASLPYVRGVAVVGSVGRGTPWPRSDIDLLVAADEWERQDPEPLITAEEKARNERLAAARIPTEVEPSHWVILANDVAAAAIEPDDTFFKRLQHLHWHAIVIKSEGATAATDFDGRLAAFLARCNAIVFSDRFVEIWVRSVIDDCSMKLESARRFLKQGDCVNASLEVLRATFQRLSSGWYAIWRQLPQSLARGISRFVAAARRAEYPDIGALYLTAAALTDDEVAQRLASLPPEGQRLCELHLAMRRGAGEDVDEHDNARDVLNVLLADPVRSDESPGRRPAWTGCTDDEALVRRRLEAAEEMLRRLREAHRELKGEMAP